MNSLWVCGVSNTVKTGKVCECSGSENTCTDVEYCYGGVCNTNPAGIFIIFPIVIFLFQYLYILAYRLIWENSSTHAIQWFSAAKWALTTLDIKLSGNIRHIPPNGGDISDIAPVWGDIKKWTFFLFTFLFT